VSNSPAASTRRLRKALLIAHVVASVGWLGVSFAMFTLAVTARATARATARHSAYWAMHLLAEVLVIPVSLVALVTGIGTGLATSWGVLRYRWVVTKLVVTTVAVGLSVFALPTRTAVALRASSAPVDTATVHRAGTDLIVAASVSTTLYLSLTVVAVLKPWGRTVWGRRSRQAGAPPAASRTAGRAM
jgi:hypothetical protein